MVARVAAPKRSWPAGGARAARLLGAALAWSGCAALDPQTAPELHRERLLAMEARLAPEALAYAPHASAPFAADGVAVDGASIRVWSRSSTEQARARVAGDSLEGLGTWTAPAPATRCVAGSGRLPAALFCAGPLVPGGVVAPDAPAFRAALPRRGGFRDLALDPARGLIHVVDGVRDLLLTLDASGALVATTPTPPGVYRIIPVADRALALLSGPSPRLALCPLQPDGLPASAPIPAPRAAPARDGVYDQTLDLLWLVGPEPGPPRRADGPLRHLRSTLVSLRPSSLVAGDARPVLSVDLGAHGLVDATRVVSTGRLLAIAATGSDAVAFVDPSTTPPTITTFATGPAPVGLAPCGDAVLVAHRLDATLLLLHPDRGVLSRLALAPPPDPDDLAALGARLFHRAGLWRSPTADAITCNTCHWDTGSDHRMQPGFLERRHELTRPLGGIGAVAPIFTTGGADSLAQAVEGLVRGLDDRFWQGPRHGGAWWEQPLRLLVPGGKPLTLSPGRVREALLTFVATLPRTPGPLRVGDPTPSALVRRGFELFADQCASCHALTPDMRGGLRLPPDRALDWLQARGLAFAAPVWSRAGIEPSFHPQGNRVAPLVDLGRPGPFFSNGSAASLSEVLARLRPGTTSVHGGQPGETPTVPADQRRALEAFLLWL